MQDISDVSKTNQRFSDKTSQLRKAYDYVQSAETIVARCKAMTGKIEGDFYSIYMELNFLIDREFAKDGK